MLTTLSVISAAGTRSPRYASAIGAGSRIGLDRGVPVDGGAQR